MVFFIEQSLVVTCEKSTSSGPDSSVNLVLLNLKYCPILLQYCGNTGPITLYQLFEVVYNTWLYPKEYLNTFCTGFNL